MGTKLDFINNNIVGHVFNCSNAMVATALQGCHEDDCDVRTYDGTAGPDWVRFWSQSTPSPQTGFWWIFDKVGDELPDASPPPEAGTSAPWWRLNVDPDSSFASAERGEETAMPSSKGEASEQ